MLGSVFEMKFRALGRELENIEISPRFARLLGFKVIKRSITKNMLEKNGQMTKV